MTLYRVCPLNDDPIQSEVLGFYKTLEHAMKEARRVAKLDRVPVEVDTYVDDIQVSCVRVWYNGINFGERTVL